MDNSYYVYEHWRTDTNTCFYVGKGKGKRAWDMRRGRNRHHQFVVSKLAQAHFIVEVKIISSDLTESEAFEFEVERIRYWTEVRCEALVNMTEGGEGPSGRKHTEEEKRNLSEKLKGRVVSAETRAKLSVAAMGNQRGLGTKKTPEQIEKTAAAIRGRKHSEEARAKMSATRRANPRVGFKMSPEAVEKTRIAITGLKRSEETRAKMRKPKSEEHKKKLAEATRAYHARQRLEGAQG